MTREELLTELRSGAINFDDKAIELIETYTQAKVLEARIDEFNIANKYIELDYTECHGFKCRVAWCGSCFGEEEAEEVALRLKKERVDRLAKLNKELDETRKK